MAGPGPAAALWSVLDLPTVTVEIEPWEERAWHAARFPPAVGPIFPGYVGQAVLDLDVGDEAYLAGHDRRQLRNHVRRAIREGVRAVELNRFDEWYPLARAVLGPRPCGPAELARMSAPDAAQRMGWFAALDRFGRPVALGGVAVFGSAGVLFSLVGRPDRPEANDARYLLHCFIRSRLRERGLHYLLAGPALALPDGLQLFQHMLGYRVVNLVIVHRAGWPAGWALSRGRRSWRRSGAPRRPSRPGAARLRWPRSRPRHRSASTARS